MTFKYFNGTNFVDLTGVATITSTFYAKNYNESSELSKTGVLNENGRFCTTYELLFGNYEYDLQNNYSRTFKGTREHSYWLASEYAYADDHYAYWGLRSVNDVKVMSHNHMFRSYISEDGYSLGVRPIVSLKSNIDIKWNETKNEWQIQ